MKRLLILSLILCGFAHAGALKSPQLWFQSDGSATTIGEIHFDDAAGDTTVKIRNTDGTHKANLQVEGTLEALGGVLGLDPGEDIQEHSPILDAISALHGPGHIYLDSEDAPSVATDVLVENDIDDTVQAQGDKLDAFQALEDAEGFFHSDGAGGYSWEEPESGEPGGGTVTSVGLSLPAIFDVSGSPVTASGTLTAALATQTANTVLAGPTTGSAAAPTVRSLVAADIPDISGTYQPRDGDLDYLAGFTPSANAKSLLNAADYAGMRTLLSLRPGTEVEAWDSDLDELAARTVTQAYAWNNATPFTTNQTTLNLFSATPTTVNAFSNAAVNLSGAGKLTTVAGNLNVVGTATVAGLISSSAGASTFKRTTSGTNAIENTATQRLTSSGTVADGFGPLLGYAIEGAGLASTNIGFTGFMRAGADNTGAFLVRTITAGSAANTFTVTGPMATFLTGVTINGTVAGGKAYSNAPTALTNTTGTGQTIALDASLDNIYTVTVGHTTAAFGAPTNPSNGQVIEIWNTWANGVTPYNLFGNSAFAFEAAHPEAHGVGTNKTDVHRFRYLTVVGGGKWCSQGTLVDL